MKNIMRILFLQTVLLIFLIKGAESGIDAVSITSHEEKTDRVLFLNSYHRGYSWSDGIEQGLREGLNSSGRKIDFYIEYLDTQRFPDLVHLPDLARVLAVKHGKIHYNIIITSDNNAFNFAIKYRNLLFPDSPLAFCGYNSFRPEILDGIKNVTGVNEEIDFTGTIDMALTVHPETDTLVFITSDYYSSGKINQERAENFIIPAYRDRYRIIQHKNLYMEKIEQTLSELPGKTLVFVFGDPLDNLDKHFIPSPEYYRRLAAASTVPAYSFWDFTLNTGMMGGNIITGPDQGRQIADLALEILNGTPADSIPVVMKSPASKIFDFNVMQRFGITEKSLPDGCKVINKPDSFYNRYKEYVWITTSIFIILTFMVLLLSLFLRRSRILSSKLFIESEERQRAVTELKQNKEQLEVIVTERTIELRRAYESLQEREALFHGMFDKHSAVMYLLNPDDGRIIDANRAAQAYYGYTLSELQSMNIYAINQLSREEIEVKLKQAKNEQLNYFEYRHRIADGSIRDVEIYSTPVEYKGKNILFSIVHDITDRKIAENDRERLIAELREAISQVRTLSGMLPICASCKKIRDDKGNWEPMEIYVKEHSGAEFSHSICPDCAQKLYPNLKIDR